MSIQKTKKTFIKIVIVITVFEFLYLGILPYFLTQYLNKEGTKEFIGARIPIKTEYSNLSVRTHIFPYISIKADKLILSDKTVNEEILNTDKPYIKLSLLPIIAKKINIKEIQTDNAKIYIKRDEQGIFNFENIFPKNGNSKFKADFSNTILNIKDYQINYQDIKENYEIKGSQVNVENKKDKQIKIKAIGDINAEDTKTGSFDVDLKINYPFELKKIRKEMISGNCTLYNINLEVIKPILDKYTNNEIKKLEGLIDYIQITAQDGKDSNSISINSSINNFVFDKKGWKNYIQADGNHQIQGSIEPNKDTVKINTLTVKADEINIKSAGSIDFKETPNLDIDVEVKESRAERIAKILPPNLVPKQMTIEKIKDYGVFGDLEAKVNIKGKIPQPDITGWVKAKDVHILDKSLHREHKGQINITFDKRILNMDILVEMLNNQKAEVKGHTYMYRDGVNDITVKTTNNIDFRLARKIIIPISKVFNFMLGPIPEMDITSGRGIIDMRIRGSMDFIDMQGYSKFDGASLTYNGLYAKMYNGKGRLDFNGDVIKFKSDKVYVKNNFVDIDGTVKINDYLDFNIKSNKTEASDLLELINNSELLKDVKAGLAVITEAQGPLKIGVNIKAKIVPVPFGHPPLPPEEAFEDMKVKGSVNLLGNSAKIIGFETPINNLTGNTDFTETVTDIINIDGISGKSPIKIKGRVINDLKTKIPDVDITVTSDGVYLGDTIRFLTKSYLYPKNYPDLSVFYNLDSKHDLYFKYKAKSIDFVTNKAYAVMNFIKDNSENILKAKSGRIIMKNSEVTVDNVIADLFGSDLTVTGNVERIDTINPLYNLDINTKIDLSNLNNTDKIDIIPDKAKEGLRLLKDYKGITDVNLKLKKNIITSKLDFKNLEFKESKTDIPFKFDDFSAYIENDKANFEYVAGAIGDMPFFGNFKLSDIYKLPKTDSYFTLKLTDNFIKNYLPEDISKLIAIEGDINLSADIKGALDNLNINHKLTFYPDSDAVIAGINLGEITNTREFIGEVNITKDKINLKKMDYIKYFTSQNNTVYPVLFAAGNAELNIDEDTKQITPESAYIKTEKNLPARILNLFLKKAVINQGLFNCDLKYKLDKENEKAVLTGSMDSRNLDIPIFDANLKNISVKADNEGIDINLFGFMNDSRVRLKALLENNLYKTPDIKSLNISADEINNQRILENISNLRKTMNLQNDIKNSEHNGIAIENGSIDIKTLIIKSLIAENAKGNFKINKQGIFTADNITIDVGEGRINGEIEYNLNDSSFKGDFELANVDANYIAETLLDGKNQIYGNANGKIIISSKGNTDEEIIKNLSGLILFEINDGRMPKLGSLEYLLRASNILKSGITGLTINSILELLNLVKTGYFSNINGSCIIENGIAKDIEIYSTGENLSLYIQGEYDISTSTAKMEILGKLSKRISTIFGAIGNTSLNTFFKLIPGISMLDFGRKDFIEDVEKIPPFTNGEYESRVFQAIINGDINSSGYVQSFKWVKN